MLMRAPVSLMAWHIIPDSDQCIRVILGHIFPEEIRCSCLITPQGGGGCQQVIFGAN